MMAETPVSFPTPAGYITTQIQVSSRDNFILSEEPWSEWETIDENAEHRFIDPDRSYRFRVVWVMKDLET